jgi:ferrous iron transport protein B
MGYNVSLRRREAWLVEVIPGEEYRVETAPEKTSEVYGCMHRHCRREGKSINVALVGNPNSGKTSLFNQASGAHERTGNYSGVTVDARETTIHHRGYRINLTDLPGTYSVTEYTPEELFVRTRLLEGKPDVVINVVDASNLERNLYLTTQLIEMNVRVIIALNMYDELQKSGATLKYMELGTLMGIPVVPTVAVRGRGIIELLNRVVEVFRGEDTQARSVRINYGNTIEESLEKIQREIMKNGGSPGDIPARYLSVKLLEGDGAVTEMIAGYPEHSNLPGLAQAERERLPAHSGRRQIRSWPMPATAS